MDKKEFFIFSDIDGTLVEAPEPIPERNIEALRRFTGAGGRFALATGRAPASALQYVRQLPVNAPCIQFNGGMIYDFAAEREVYSVRLPDSYEAYLRMVADAFPDIGVTLFDGPTRYCLCGPELAEEYLGMERVPFVPLRFSQIRGPYLKAIFIMHERREPEVEAFINEQRWTDVGFVRSSPNFLEMLPLGIHKGAGLKRYRELFKVDWAGAIGDYHNDMTMLREADYGAAVAAAPEAVKKVCRFVTGPCRDGALGDLLEHLWRTVPGFPGGKIPEEG